MRPVDVRPYFFVDLADTTESDELAAIRAGTIKHPASRLPLPGRCPMAPPTRPACELGLRSSADSNKMFTHVVPPAA
jgi:hypothetical protein